MDKALRAKFVYETFRLLRQAVSGSSPVAWESLPEQTRARMTKLVTRQCSAGRYDTPQDLYEEWLWIEQGRCGDSQDDGYALALWKLCDIAWDSFREDVSCTDCRQNERAL